MTAKPSPGRPFVNADDDKFVIGFLPYNDNGGGGEEGKGDVTVIHANLRRYVDPVQVKIGHKMMDITSPPPISSTLPPSLTERQTARQSCDTWEEPGVEAIYSVPGWNVEEEGVRNNGELLIPSPPPPLFEFTSVAEGESGETCVTS